MDINFLAVAVSTIIAMALGAWWYGPLFGKRWLEVIGATEMDLEARKEMQKSAGPLYGVQFALTVLQVSVLAYLLSTTDALGGITHALLIYLAFIVPTVAAGAMWNNDSAKVSWARFLIQGGYQLVLFLMFGLILTLWN